MSQQVNLYQPVFRKQKRKFSAVAMLQATALIVLGAAALYGFTWWQVRQLRAETAQTDKQLAALTKRLDDLTRQFGERLQSKELQQRIQQIEAELADKQQLQELMRAADFNTQGFSDYLIALARQHTPGVWLTGFSILGAGEQVTLTGRSTQPELVPRYLHRLSSERRLSGIEFEAFQMNRPAPDPKGVPAPYVEFLARSGAESQLPAPPAKAAP